MNETTEASRGSEAGPDQNQVKNGQRVLPPQEKPRTLADSLRNVIGVLDGPTDLAEQHDHYAHGAPRR